ncbi:MAG: GAF domain-containing protein [Spirochaetales bacterium]|nr:GAF domain-containing protein [Spirochaetales bacterium]
MELVKALTETSSLLAYSQNRGELLQRLVERACYETGSDLTLLYSYDKNRFTPLYINRGNPSEYPFEGEGDFVRFLDECGEYVVSHRGQEGPFPALLLKDRMVSAAACPLMTNGDFTHLLVLNGKRDFYYTQDRLTFLESACRVAQCGLERFAAEGS